MINDSCIRGRKSTFVCNFFVLVLFKCLYNLLFLALVVRFFCCCFFWLIGPFKAINSYSDRRDLLFFFFFQTEIFSVKRLRTT